MIDKKNTRKIIFIIILIIIVASIGFLFVFLNRPENIVKTEIDQLASHYYEDIFYENMLNSKNFSGDAAQTLSKYTESGISPLTLRQLVSIDSFSSSKKDYLYSYCDESSTLVRFYPDPPYSRTSYHTDIVYSCNF